MMLYVNDEKIADELVHQEMERLRADYQRVFSDQSTDQQEQTLYEWSKENLVEQILFRQIARRAEPQPSEQEIKAMYNRMLEENGGKAEFFSRQGFTEKDEPQLKQQVADQISIQRLIDQITSTIKQPSEKEIQNYYNNNSQRFTIPEMIKASHIVKHLSPEVESDDVRNELLQVVELIHQGRDFAELVAEYSDCPDNGGDLGYFARGKMVPAFENVVFAMKVGEVSDIFQTEFGFHIAKVTDRKPSVLCPIEDVKDFIVKELCEKARQKAIEQFIDQEKKNAVIEDR